MDPLEIKPELSLSCHCSMILSLDDVCAARACLAMMLSLYGTLGIFLLLAARNPSANRSLITFTAWSSFAHAALMAVQAFRNLIPRGELLGVAALVIIGVALSAGPGKAVRRTAIRSQCVGSHSGETPTPTSPILKEAKAEYAKLQ